MLDLRQFECGNGQLAPIGAHWRLDLYSDFGFAAAGASWDFDSNMALMHNSRPNGRYRRSDNRFGYRDCTWVVGAVLAHFGFDLGQIGANLLRTSWRHLHTGALENYEDSLVP